MGNHLQNSLTNLIELFTSHSNRQGVIKGDLDPTQMAEHVVDLVDPKIRVINRYVQKLIPPVTHAWDYLSDVAVDIPGGDVFSKSAFINDPRTRLIVGSQEEMSSLLNSANQLLEHKPVQTCDSQTDMYFLLCMEIKEHNFFGAELSGEIIKREVQQTSVKFINRKILSAG